MQEKLKPTNSSLNESAATRETENALSRQFAATPDSHSTVGMILGDEFDLMTAVGGVRGIIEAVIPTLVFLVGFVWLNDHVIPALAALAVCILLILVRIIQRIPVSPALGGLFAMAISVVLVWRSGEASDMFLWGILINILYFVVLAVSVLVKWPLIGVFIAFFKGESMDWRLHDTARVMRRCYYQLTWLWVGVFALRLVVQLPLYFAKQTEALGIAKLVMGLPLFALALWFSWLLYRAADRVNSRDAERVNHVQQTQQTEQQ